MEPTENRLEPAKPKTVRHFTMRMPESLAQRLEQHARAAHRSLHGEILYLLDHAVPETMVEFPASVPWVGPGSVDE